jgi:hypothetical protein
LMPTCSWPRKKKKVLKLLHAQISNHLGPIESLND